MSQYLIASLLYRYSVEAHAVSPLPVTQADCKSHGIDTMTGESYVIIPHNPIRHLPLSECLTH